MGYNEYANLHQQGALSDTRDMSVFFISTLQMKNRRKKKAHSLNTALNFAPKKDRRRNGIFKSDALNPLEGNKAASGH